MSIRDKLQGLPPAPQELSPEALLRSQMLKALRAEGKAELAAELEDQVARAQKERAAQQRMDLLKDAVARGMLKPDEEQKIIQAAKAMGVSTGELLRQMESAAQAMAQPLAQVGEAMRKTMEDALASINLPEACDAPEWPGRTDREETWTKIRRRL